MGDKNINISHAQFPLKLFSPTLLCFKFFQVLWFRVLLSGKLMMTSAFVKMTFPTYLFYPKTEPRLFLRNLWQ